ncbi:STT3 domain-containing protein [Methanobacterium congolense]|uniref:dolichyl-phosphooligosaccharide-protein glycotransferase n=1 Tax=Methanobacterium congolense TaxID=118062 RepID=A0A1D3L3A9_9EURY|nr:STT3 domain-containing protein [Methanobacterium congolense]SCG86009.1 Dolichyl-phosphooligosaccharide-protein glycotransferase [Methanobacterium congolense]
MFKRQTVLIFVIILIIFSLGFSLRLESTNLSGIPTDEKVYYQDQNGLPYMYDMDSYYNYRLTKNYLNHGYLGDTKVNGTEWDFHSYAPSGVPMDYPPLIVYLTAFIYKFFNLFADVPLMVICFWLPAFIAPIGGVVAYLFVRRFTNEYGAVAAGVLTVIAPFYFMRTVPGWFDTDMFNLIFPLLIVWFFVEALKSKDIKMKGIFASLSAFFMVLFAMAWNGWQYLFYVLVLFSIFYGLFRKVRGKNVKNFLLVALTFFPISAVLIYIFTGFFNVLNFILGPKELLSIFSTNGLWAPWPDVYVLISELQPPSAVDLVSGVGPAVFILGIIGILVISMVLRSKKLHENYLNQLNWAVFSLLVLWTVTGFLTLIKGIRFLLMVIPPLTIITGLCIGFCADFLEIHSKKNFKRFAMIFILILITLPSVVVINDNLSSLTPRMNDDMWNAGVWIHNNTQNDTVVVASWMYGHFFTAISDRPTSIDGRLAYVETMPVRDYDVAFTFGDKSPSTSREYWIDKAYTTDNETLALGILRMITTTGDAGYLNLDNYTQNTTKTIEILNNILGVDKNTAKNLLIENYGLKPDQADNVLRYTHPNNPRPFVIVTDNSMINKGYWTFYFGSWDFNKLSGNCTYSYGTIHETGNILTTDDGITMDLQTGNLTWNNHVPYSVTVVSKGTLKNDYLDKNSDFCVIINRDTNRSVVLDRQYENSLFSRLVVEKQDTKYFKAVYENNNVIVWESKY